MTQQNLTIDLSTLNTSDLVSEIQKRKESANSEIMSELSNMNSKSSKIKFLNQKGYTRSEIAKILNIRYQFVRNVLIAQK